jgi:hypothetical protein
LEFLKILIYSDGVYDGFKDGFFQYIDSILDVLRKKTNVKEIWVTPYLGKISNFNKDTFACYNIYDFKNSVEVLDILKPDMVMISNSQEDLSRSLLFAAKYRSIPSVIAYSGTPIIINPNIFKIIKARIYAFPKLGKIFLKKYIFLIKTFFAIDQGLIFVIKNILRDIYFIVTSFTSEFKSDNADLYICNNEEWMEYALQKKIPKDKIFVVGEYVLDHIYRKLPSLKRIQNDKIEILFIGTSMVEHGYWSGKMRDNLLSEIIKKINIEIGEDANLKIKIHPTSENINDYKQVVEKTGVKTEIIQKGDVIEMINDSDVIVSFGRSNVFYQVILLKKPLLVLNPYNDLFYKTLEGIVTECKNVDELIKNIRDYKQIKLNDITYENFVKKKFYKFDGKCSERAAAQLINLLSKTHKI